MEVFRLGTDGYDTNAVYRYGVVMSFPAGLPQPSQRDMRPRTFYMNKPRPQTQRNKIEILKQCYRLMAQGTWDAISVAELEKNISQTRGAIFYFNKNKNDLFLNMIDELFYPVFVLSNDEKARLSACSVSQFYATYKTPFDRLKEDLTNNYGLPNGAQAVFNIIVQAQKHYEGFSVLLKKAMDDEMAFIDELTGGSIHEFLSYNNFMIQNIGNLFLDSLELFHEDRVHE